MGSLPGAIPPFKVFVIGGLSYAGVSTTLNLLDLSSGKSPRLAHIPYEHHPDLKNVPVEITLVDERDGFCKNPVKLPDYITKHPANMNPSKKST